MFVLFPAGCRHVQLSVWRGFVDAVWPAVWPAVVMAAYVTVTRSLVGNSLVGVGAEMVAAVFVYAATYLLVGVDRSERRFYLAKLAELGGRLRLQTPTVSEGA
jgi:hypothetical protein